MKRHLGLLVLLVPALLSAQVTVKGIVTEQPDQVRQINLAFNNPYWLFEGPSPLPDTGWKPATSLYFELLGKGLYSLNLDFRIKEPSAFSIGAQLDEGAFLPNLMYFRFFGKKRRLETGVGSSIVLERDYGISGMSLHGVVGYRYQKKKGLIFRVGFTPLYGIPFREGKKNVFVPLGGISLGYCF